LTYKFAYKQVRTNVDHAERKCYFGRNDFMWTSKPLTPQSATAMLWGLKHGLRCIMLPVASQGWCHPVWQMMLSPYFSLQET